MKSGFAIPALILFLFALPGCREGLPPEVMEEPLYTDLLAEVFLTRSRVDYLDTREQEDSLVHVLMQRYDVSPEAFRASHEYYQRQPERQAARVNAIREQMSAERDSLLETRKQYRIKQRETEETEETE